MALERKRLREDAQQIANGSLIFLVENTTGGQKQSYHGRARSESEYAALLSFTNMTTVGEACETRLDVQRTHPEEITEWILAANAIGVTMGADPLTSVRYAGR